MFGHPTATYEEDIAVLEADVARAIARLDPDSVALASAPALFARFDRIARSATAARTLLARKVEESRAWQASGHSDAADWLAEVTGSTRGSAKADLATSRALQDLPSTKAAMLAGEVSPAQGATIADAATANPQAEQKLLAKATAQRSNLRDLREEAGRAKAAADADPAATQRRIHGERRLSRFTDSEGARHVTGRGTVEDGATIDRAIDPIIDELYRAHRGGERGSRDAYAWDALVELCRRAIDAPGPAGAPTNPRYLGLIRVDLAALQRGHVEGEELCEITGVGPIPVERAKALLGESIVKLVLTKGVDVCNVTSLGRGPTAAMKVALAWSSPTCTVEGCSRTYLESDHRAGVEFRTTRHTRLDELDQLCPHHHRLKTHQGWALVEGSGRRAFVAPDHPRHPARAAAAAAAAAPVAPPSLRPAADADVEAEPSSGRARRSPEQVRAFRSAVAKRVADTLQAQLDNARAPSVGSA